MGIKASWAPSLSFHLNKVQPDTIHNVNASLILLNRPIKSSAAQPPLYRHHPGIQIHTTTATRRAEGLMDVYYLSLSDWIWITLHQVTLPSQNTRIITATNNAQSVCPCLLAELWSYCPPQSITEETESNIDFEIQIHRITEGRRFAWGLLHFLNLHSSKLVSPTPKK